MKVKLYRCMSEAEYDDLIACGQFRGCDRSYESGKWFAESAKDAARWGEWFDSVESAPTRRIIIEIQLPVTVADQLFRRPQLDAIGPARFVPLAQLRGVAFREVKA